MDDSNSLRGGTATPVSLRLGRPLEEGLARLLTSAAYGLFMSGQKEEITFHQFCRFAELSARDKWQKVRGKLTSLEHLVEEARKLGEAGEGASIWVGERNQKFSPEELRMLDPLAKFLAERFKNEMEEWKRKALA